MKPKDVTEIDKRVAANIRRERRLQDMTQVDLADKLDITFQQIQKYEKAINRITIGRFVQIAEALGVSVEELLDESV